MTAPSVHALDDLSNYVFVPNRASVDVAVIDTRTDAVVAHVPVGEVPHQVAVSQSLGKMVVSNTADDTVTVIDLATLRTSATIQLGHEPEHIELDSSGTVAAIGNIGEGTVSLVSLSAEHEVARLSGAADMTGVNTGWFDSLAYVISRGDDKALIIDLETMQTAGEIALPGTPETGVVTPDGTKLYVALSDADTVAVIDVKAKAVVAMIEGVGEEPWGAHSRRGQLLPLGTATTASLRIAAGTRALAAQGASAAAEASSVAPRDRLLGAVQRHAALPAALGAKIERRCPPRDTRCAAQLIADSLPAARLVPVNHPDTDTIWRAHTVPSLSAVERRNDGALVVVLDRFGRTADREIADAVSAHALGTPARLVLDLRGNSGGAPAPSRRRPAHRRADPGQGLAHPARSSRSRLAPRDPRRADRGAGRDAGAGPRAGYRVRADCRAVTGAGFGCLMRHGG